MFHSLNLQSSVMSLFRSANDPPTAAPLSLDRQERSAKALSPPPCVNLRSSDINRNVFQPFSLNGTLQGAARLAGRVRTDQSRDLLNCHQPKFEWMKAWKWTCFNLSLIRITRGTCWHLAWIRLLHFLLQDCRAQDTTRVDARRNLPHANLSGSTKVWGLGERVDIISDTEADVYDGL